MAEIDTARAYARAQPRLGAILIDTAYQFSGSQLADYVGKCRDPYGMLCARLNLIGCKPLLRI